MKTIDFRTDILPLKNELYRLALRITLNPAEAEDADADAAAAADAGAAG
jgi:RNA polymerase sigma-70 factor (ECF subfamily)